ncbi:hypothetical protein ACFSB1_16855 [Halopseudomonas phragmitis]|uniref:ABC transporter n=2 Tax=Pseudomonadaceae TaxID=135621 RepID=A0A1V0B387_9GAMM|nr:MULTISPECIES: hypothetical protein [Pseudomonadaceae]AQZ94399.1 hypothetical protein BVH74_06360 [Halopseudomonas phragmitis]RHW21350.1 ABC transporter [Pseudomonas jilinensis]
MRLIRSLPLLLLMLGLSPGLLAQGNQLNLTSLNWPPYSAESLPGQGSITSRIRQALANYDLDLAVRFLPWNRAVKQATEDPHYLGYYPEYLSPNSDCLYSKALGTSSLGLAYHSDQALHWETLEDLSPYRIGVVSGYHQTPAFDQQVAAGLLQVEEGVNDQINLLKLLYRRVDLVVVDREVMRHWQNQLPSLRRARDQLQFHPRLLGELSLHVCFNNTQAGRAARDKLDRQL